MPTYAYECAACGHAFEEFQTMTAGALRKCPACKAARLKRLIGPGAGFIFKGTGFYITDYKNKRSGGGDSSDKGSDAPAKPVDAPKTDAPAPDKATSDSGKSARGASKAGSSGSGKAGRDRLA